MSCAAQQPDLESLLDRAAAQEAILADSLPSFSCKRVGTSELLKASDGSVKKHVTFTGDVRALRMPGRGLQEELTYSSVNGKAKNSRDGVPYDIHESFTAALQYVAHAQQECWKYTASPGPDGGTRVDFTAAAPFQLRCENQPGTAGFLIADADGNITHVERTVPERLANEADLSPFAAVDLTPVVLDGTTYRLVSRLKAQRQDGGEMRTVDVRYTECKLFHADVKLLPDVETVPETK